MRWVSLVCEDCCSAINMPFHLHLHVHVVAGIVLPYFLVSTSCALLPLSQLVTYEFAVLGLWVYGGVLSEFLKYTHQEGSNANFDTLSESLLSMFQVGVV
jgi:hypothetical protein